MDLEEQIPNVKNDSDIIDIEANQKLYEITQKLYEITQESPQIDRFKQDTKARQLLAKWAMFVVSIWLSIVLLILIFSSKISDYVLMTLLGTTTLNVLGLIFIVLKGHFPENK